MATAGAAGVVRLYEAANGCHLADLAPSAPPVPGDGGTGRAAARSIAFLPDGRTLAAGGDDRTVHLYDVATGTEVRALPGHEGAILSAFSPDGRLLASGSADTTGLVWDVAALTSK